MKYTLLILAVLFFSPVFSQNNSDAIVGKWIRIPKEDMIIEVFKSGNEYKGKITWTKDNDKNKPIGFIILEDLNFNQKKTMWTNGKIQDPNSGRTYDAEAKIKSNGILEVLGYLGLKMIGSTKEFKRVT